jgi:hypothetical protein
MEREGSAVGALFLIFLLALLAGSLYLLYLNLPGDTIEYERVEIEQRNDFEENIVYSKSKQFYERMRFQDPIITYKIERACDSKKKNELREAFSILEEKTILTFSPSERGQITILCTELAPEAETEDYFVAGEGGPTEVINTSLYAVIFSGKVSFFREEKCENPNIALHEILHVLGFDHNDNPRSILFPTLDCEQEIDDNIIKDINSLYSIEGQPDLKIESVDASKSGRYLNFEIEVSNQGLKNARDVSLRVYYDGKLIKFEGDREELELEDIEVGTRKVLTVANARISRSSQKIRFVVDEENSVDEIFEDNNDLELVLVGA